MGTAFATDIPRAHVYVTSSVRHRTLRCRTLSTNRTCTALAVRSNAPTPGARSSQLECQVFSLWITRSQNVEFEKTLVGVTAKSGPIGSLVLAEVRIRSGVCACHQQHRVYVPTPPGRPVCGARREGGRTNLSGEREKRRERERETER